MAERSQSPARNGLTTIFSKSRRDKKNRSSASNSLRSAASTVGTGTDSDSHAFGGALGSAIDQSKGYDDDAPTAGSDGSGLKKLIPKLGKRRQRKQEQEEEQLALEEAERGRTVADRGTLANESRSRSRSRRRSPLPRTYFADAASPLMYDSEPDSEV